MTSVTVPLLAIGPEQRKVPIGEATVDLTLLRDKAKIDPEQQHLIQVVGTSFTFSTQKPEEKSDANGAATASS